MQTYEVSLTQIVNRLYRVEAENQHQAYSQAVNGMYHDIVDESIITTQILSEDEIHACVVLVSHDEQVE